MAEGPGRACPLGYRYGAASLRSAPSIEADTIYVAGGLYGNPEALDAVLELAAAEPGARLVFNGDFNWFDVDPEDYRRVNESVLAHCAIRGNVEAELASPAQGAGCGCGYPDWVGDAEVERSNRILERLRGTAAAQPALTARLGELPMFAVARVGTVRVAIVHGDADSLSGWAYSQEALATPAGLAAARAHFGVAGVDVIACSHTCLPVLQAVATSAGEAVIANNGAAGMPNFRGTHYGVVTRVSISPPRGRVLYGARAGIVHVHAVPVDYDARAWERRFLAQWPAGSDAHQSYFRRISEGPAYERAQAMRGAAQPAFA